MIVMEERHTNVILIVCVICLSVLHETVAALVLRWNTIRPTEPFVMVRYNNGRWGEICAGLGTSTEFNDKAANVTCRQMGFLDGKVHERKVQANTSEIILDYVVCPTGEESSLSQCQYRPSNASSKCPFNFAIKVECTENPALNGLFNTTLLGEKKAHEGILKVTKDGTDGEVCYDATTADAVAKVVCKQMGYSGVDNTAMVDSYSNTTSFYDARCPNGTEQTLAACNLTASSCSNTKNVLKVTCSLDKATQRRFDIRLSSPTNSPLQGTVEVYQYGHWGVICDTDWNIHEAEVVCRELGYKSAQSKETGTNFGQGTGVVFWNNMQCNAYEPSIANCITDVALGTQTCDSANAAGVVCNTTERIYTINICLNGPKVLEAGYTMIQSEAQPKPFSYSRGQTCFLNLTTPTNFTVYIYKKMFEENHVEYLSFISADRNETLYGDDSRQGPFDFSSRRLTIEFNADTASGSGVINIMVSVAKLPEPPTTPAAMTTTTNGNDHTSDPKEGGGSTNAVAAPPEPPTTPAAMTTETNGNDCTSTPEEIRDDGGPTNAGKIGGAVVGGLALIAAVLVVNCSLYIKFKQRSKKRKSSVGSYENNVNDQEDGVENTALTPDSIAANPAGNGVIPEKATAKEPETGETETNLTRTASDSGINVEIERASTGLNAYEVEELPKGGDLMIHAPSPIELEGAPTNQASTLGVAEPVTKGPPHFMVGGPSNQEYAMVNKPKMGTALPPLSPKGTVGNQEYAVGNKYRKGLPPLAPKYTVGDQEYAVVNKPKNDTGGVPLSVPTVPPKNLDGPRSPDVPGDNLVKDQSTEPPVTGVPEYNPYQDDEEDLNQPFNKPNSFVPGVSAAYADVELGAPGEASKIQDQPKQEEPTKTEKKKKHGKDKKKPEKEKKKKWGKDKKKSKENLAEDAAHAPVGNDSCAVPMRDDLDMPPEGEYAEVGARRRVGHMNPACQPELNNSENYDHLDFKGRKTAPQNPGGEATYDTVHGL